MADLVHQTTCVDRAGARVPVNPSPLDPAVIEKTFGEERSCDGAASRPGSTKNGVKLFDQDVCIPGSGFLFGSEDIFGLGDLNGLPEHVAVLRPFFIDRYEVTVARWRDALARGFTPPQGGVTANTQPFERDSCRLQRTSDPVFCTFTAAPGPFEDHAMSCVRWDAARAFCQFDGGDLPTEAQWEYVARVARKPAKARFS